ncbi:hypothetical protein IFM89_015945 [Coptis chinensis]|uniref:RING-type domain-containing protein n=1 Tax=Coptis chinensis TaxID=261450 RepID=A0A835LRR9_9MAGN|nr:hypothetical protein IFM89_015945 [Coptis chinensis]
MIGTGINLVMTVIGFAVSTMFIVFVCTRLICARIQMNASRRSFPTASTSNLDLLERGIHGLEPAVYAKFDMKKFSDEFFSSSEAAQCTVCLADYQEKDVLRILPYCGHSFHVACIDIWLQQNSTCPICRISLRGSPERKRIMQPMLSSAIRSSHSMAPRYSHSYRFSYASQGYSSRSIDNRRMEPIQEDQFALDLNSAEAGGNFTSFPEVNRALKDIGCGESDNKLVDSPSNQ